MTERMEEILESQNALTADYGHTVKGVDLASAVTTLTTVSSLPITPCSQSFLTPRHDGERHYSPVSELW